MEVLFPRLCCWIKEKVACERGSNLAEVVLAVSLIALAAVAGMDRMANQVDHAFLHISENLASIFDSSNFGIGNSPDGGQSSGGGAVSGSNGGGTAAGNRGAGATGNNGGGGIAGASGGAASDGGGSGGAGNGGGGNRQSGTCGEKNKKENCGGNGNSNGAGSGTT
jgi:Flp pilus assembly pilin Flp